jgi:hypothetical protein
MVLISFVVGRLLATILAGTESYKMPLTSMFLSIYLVIPRSSVATIHTMRIRTEARLRP